MFWPRWSTAGCTVPVRCRSGCWPLPRPFAPNSACRSIGSATARWTFTQDVSDAFRRVVVQVLQALGHGDLHERL